MEISLSDIKDTFKSAWHGFETFNHWRYCKKADNKVVTKLCGVGILSELPAYNKRIMLPIQGEKGNYSVKWTRRAKKSVEKALIYYYDKSESRQILFVDVYFDSKLSKKFTIDERLDAELARRELANRLSDTLTVALSIKEYWKFLLDSNENPFKRTVSSMISVLNLVTECTMNFPSSLDMSNSPCVMLHDGDRNQNNRLVPYYTFKLPDEVIQVALEREYKGVCAEKLLDLFYNGVPFDFAKLPSVWIKKVTAQYIVHLCQYQLRHGYISTIFQLELADYKVLIG